MKKLLYGRTGKWVRRVFLFFMDMCFVLVSAMSAMSLRYEGRVPAFVAASMRSMLPWIVLIYMLCSVLGGIYGVSWRYASSGEILRMGVVYVCSGALTLLLNRFGSFRMSRPVLVVTAMIMMMLVSATRLMWRLVREFYKSRKAGKRKKRILIVGAGEGGVYAVRICQQNPTKFGTPVAFADDDPIKRHMRINGIPVAGSIKEVPMIVEKLEIDEIIVAVPSARGERLSEIITICKGTQLRTRILSDPDDVSTGGNQHLMFRELNTSDFLSREEVALNMDQIRSYLEDEVVMVTGGGGSIGSEICRQIMRFHPKQLLIFDVYENCAYELECELRRKYGENCPVEVLIGSIRDRGRLDSVFEQYHPGVVFHAAAHKHVPLMEVSPAEAVKNNVFGTLNLLESASSHGVKRFVQLSTDKAVNPTNVMGATKRITEMLLQRQARRGEMKCMAVRFGNVLGSHGSVIPLFEAQIRAGGPVTLTHPDITRYFMTIPEAAQLVLQAGGLAQSGAIYVLDMGKPVRIRDLAEKLIRFYGYEPETDIPIVITGLRPGEKLYEELLMDKERDRMTRTAHDKIFVAPPSTVDETRFAELLEKLRKDAMGSGEHVVEDLMEIVETYRPNRAMME